MEKREPEIVTVNLRALLVPIAIVLAGVMIAGAFFLGLRSYDPAQAGRTAPLVQPSVPVTQAPGAIQPVVISIDDDPILGDKETAQIAIVEFSDYECPFCASFWRETLGQITRAYIEPGKAILAYRDLPLPFHEPAATREANAAECARKLSDDKGYFQFHDQIFTKTPGNGQGITEEDLVKIATGLGLNASLFADCLQNQDFAEEIRGDIADAGRAGIQGTPGFVIGRLDDQGNVTGVVVRGAQPYSVFQAAIEQQLQQL